MVEDKRKLIMDIALEHFAAFGYEKTSTNQIIHQAGISKGILFHYFSSKKQLYATVLDHGLERVASFMKDALSELPTDLFECIVGMSRAKMNFYLHEPATYKLLVGAFSAPIPEETADLIAERRRLMAAHMSVSFENVDMSKVRAGVDPSQAFDLVTSVVNLLSTRFIERHRERPDRGLELLEPFLEQIGQYLEMIESGIYSPLNKEGNKR
ncbi:TetR/AcrR family transcriptional regulator [Paenibacillus antri]|uniref:TetR/AcrR family transcriptional regulator n=1 Tax=Paenibacillus antri TaxID=2582848 RepID=A0A5R9G5K8_9BACL|nr:TetR/AcrR family transcriptional regulator [Paenibacillus antri]TLS51652.1 TetR/AcrR family transcriptional regulator [Paenibacillus antri]